MRASSSSPATAAGRRAAALAEGFGAWADQARVLPPERQ